jgi:hypothetical protein
MARLAGGSLAGALLGLLLVGGLPAHAAAPTLKLSPATVSIGAFFQGQTVTVTGAIPTGTQAVLEVMGANADEPLMRQGRRGGLWMNVGEIAVHDAPALYLVLSSAPALLAAAPPTATWGYQALTQRLTFSGQIEARERPEFIDQFLRLKESEHIYAMQPGALKLGAAAGGETALTGTFSLPTNTRPGTYQACLSVIEDGQVVDRTCTGLTVAMVGFPAWLAALAFQHGATYGVLAVVIAIVTGFAMGFVFKGGGGH